MVPRIPVFVNDGVGKPYMTRVEQTEATPEAQVAWLNRELTRLQFVGISYSLATEEQYAAYFAEAAVVEKQRQEHL